VGNRHGGPEQGGIAPTVITVVGEEYAAILAQTGWLAGTPADFQSAILAASLVSRRQAGQPLYHSGDAVGGMFGVCQGAIEIATPLGNPDANIVHIGQPGFWFGAGPALTGVARRITVVARTDCVFAHLPLSAIQRMTSNRPEWWRHIGALAVQNMQIAIGAAADLLIRDHERRCIAVLLRLSGARYEESAPVEGLSAEVSQAELAAMAHLSRNAAGAVLRRLADRRLIELGYRAIAVRSPDRLRAMVDAPVEV